MSGTHQFTDAEGYVWMTDPTGRGAYRITWKGRWGDYICAGPGQEKVVDRFESSPARAPAPSRPGSTPDSVGGFLQAVGWFAVVASILAAFIVVADSNASSEGSPTLALAIGVGGVIQGFVLVGFGRLIGYLRSVRDLLAAALEQDS
jgi:hypothetical protein